MTSDHRPELPARPPGGKIRLYRGQTKLQAGVGSFFHPDPDFAVQFTQSGMLRELLEVDVDYDSVFASDVLPYGGDPSAIDEAILQARRSSPRYVAVWTDEGTGGTPSVFFFKKSGVVANLRPYTGADVG